MQKAMVFIIMALTGFFLTGCSVETYFPNGEPGTLIEHEVENDSSQNTSESAIVIMPNPDKLRSEVERYKYLYDNLGKRSTEIMLGINGYVWNPDRSEVFDADSGENFFVFSASVWDENSRCVGVSFLFEDILPDWDDNFPVSPESAFAFGNEITWVDESVNGPYYKYQISDSLELCIYSDEDGAFLLTKTPLLLKLSGVDAFCGLTSYNFGNLIVNNDERQDVKWRIVNKTAESIGMTEEEIASRGATHREEFSNTILYTDEATQTEYYMDGGICYMVNIPMSAAFLIWKGRDVITEEEFREYFTVPVKWSDYHFMSWSITFDDFMIYFPTDADRNVYGNSLISIRLRS